MENKNSAYTVHLEVNEQYIKNEIARQIEEKTRAEMLFCDIEELERITCMQRSYLEKYLLKDHRILIYQRRRGKGKKYWLYEPTVKMILEIVTNEWDI